MWPFSRKPKIQNINPAALNFTQLDFTERFDDRQNLAMDDWIKTIPMNQILHDGQRNNLPPIDATPEEVYDVAISFQKFERFSGAQRMAFIVRFAT